MKKKQTSTLKTNGTGGNVISHKSERDAGEISNEYGQIRKARVPQKIDCASIEPGRYDAGRYQSRRDFVDYLLPKVLKGGRQSRNQSLHLGRWQTAVLLRNHFVFIVGVRR